MNGPFNVLPCPIDPKLYNPVEHHASDHDNCCGQTVEHRHLQMQKKTGFASKVNE